VPAIFQYEAQKSIVYALRYRLPGDQENLFGRVASVILFRSSGGATPGRARSNDLAGRSTALAQALAPPFLALRIVLLR